MARPLPFVHARGRSPSTVWWQEPLWEGFGGIVPTIMKVAGIASALIAAACSGSGSGGMPDDLRKDLEQASAISDISLASSQGQGNQIVSAIERTTPPAPRKIARSQRVARHVPAPRKPAPVEVAEAEVIAEPEPAPVETAPAPVEPDVLPSPRPQPVQVSVGGGTYEGNGGGMDRGRVLGGVIQVVLRGGAVGDDDECDPRTDGRGAGRGRIAINNRFPVIGGRTGGVVGTFPGRVAVNIPGRLGGSFPARQVSRLPGRVRF